MKKVSQFIQDDWMAKEPLELLIQDVPLSHVISTYRKGFKPNPGDELVNIEWFVDVNRNTVIFKIYIKKGKRKFGHKRVKHFEKHERRKKKPFPKP